MNCHSQQSQYNSSQDQCKYNISTIAPKVVQKSKSQAKSYSHKENINANKLQPHVEKNKQKKRQSKRLSELKLQDNDEITLKPKFDHSESEQQTKKQRKDNASKLMSNASKVTIANRKNIMDAYTFKRQVSQRLKKHDPVSLYAQTRQSWNKNKFLKSRADAKQGRKLQLDKRNRNDKLL